ncbi:MAG: GNAT family N-acetyltransferase [Pseudomonadota bacterium]
MIRDYTTDDAPELARLMWDYRAAILGYGGRTAEVFDRYYPKDAYGAFIEGLPDLHAETGAIFLAELDGTVIGCAMLIPTRNPHQIEIKRIYVDPAHRGKDVAPALIAAATDRARAMGYAEMVLDTVKTLVPAIRLYERLGFETIEPFYELKPDTGDFVCFFGIRL